MEHVIHGLPVVTGPHWPGVHYFCTTRQGGVGEAPHDTLNLGLRADDRPEVVRENRRRVRAAVPSEPLWLRQVHGADVVDADVLAGIPLPEPAADASVTAARRRVLAIMVADCLPVFITDLDGKVVGAAHAGWRGLAAGVLENTLDRLRAKHPGARGWRAWVGPGIGPEHFEVGDDVRDAFAPLGAEALPHFKPRPAHPGKWLADLPALALLRLQRAGVEDVHACGLCTVSDAERFFSYRRDGITGRMALLAWRE
ncbi:peptidoglycan editing factor PgeF [Bordetella sp. 15P40C-2]|uniref:peptidoglycan editing factor PgeF n=1 Tax=Bordetella sp. 15P40C-2 TaxID=2572246 RepID=UPI0013250C6E|nr:peptidoglycan editing factor PgeF [Bordetella sp. 15P40C-2]MVW71805.1 peptidoglycan editing factor PgeF [Bordetella sp. 15P40C-2]